MLSTNEQLSNLLIVAKMYNVSRSDATLATISVAIPLKSGNFHVFLALLCATAVHATVGLVDGNCLLCML